MKVTRLSRLKIQLDYNIPVYMKGFDKPAHNIDVWSDGIGEGFEQQPCNSDEDYISPWFRNQEISAYNNVAEVRNQKIDKILK